MYPDYIIIRPLVKTRKELIPIIDRVLFSCRFADSWDASLKALGSDKFYLSYSKDDLERELCKQLGLIPEEVYKLTQGIFTRYPTPRFLQVAESVLYCTTSLQECCIEEAPLNYFGFVGPQYIWCKKDHEEGQVIKVSSEAAYAVFNNPSYYLSAPWTNTFAIPSGKDYLDRHHEFKTFQDSLQSLYGYNPWSMYPEIGNHRIAATDYTLEKALLQSSGNPNIPIYRKRLEQFLQDPGMKDSDCYRSGGARDVYLDYKTNIVYKVGHKVGCSQSLEEIKSWYQFMNPFMCPIEAVFMHNGIPIVCMPFLGELPDEYFSSLRSMYGYINAICRFKGAQIAYGLTFWDGFTVDVCDRSNWRVHQNKFFLVDYGETNNGLPVFSSWADTSLLYEPMITNISHVYLGSSMGYPVQDIV